MYAKEKDMFLETVTNSDGKTTQRFSFINR